MNINPEVLKQTRIFKNSQVDYSASGFRPPEYHKAQRSNLGGGGEELIVFSAGFFAIRYKKNISLQPDPHPKRY